MLTELATLAAVCLGISTAYLTLDPFRLSGQIRDAAQAALGRLRDLTPTHRTMAIYQVIEALAQVSPGSSGTSESGQRRRGRRQQSKKRLRELDLSKLQRAVLLGADRRFVATPVVLFSAAALAASTAGAIYWPSTQTILVDLAFWILLACLVASLALVFAGQAIVDDTIGLLRRREADVALAVGPSGQREQRNQDLVAMLAMLRRRQTSQPNRPPPDNP